MTRLTRIWKSRNISFKIKHRLYKSLVVSVLLYGCEAWTLCADTEKRVQAFESKSFRRLLGITYRERKTNEYVRDKIKELVGEQEPLLTTVKRRKLGFFGHTTRHDTLTKTILQGTLGKKRKRGRPRKSWMSNIYEWTTLPASELLMSATNRKRWRDLAAAAALQSPLRPARSRD